MATNRHAATAPKLAKTTKARALELCEQRSTDDEDRLTFDRASRKLKKSIEIIDEELEAWTDAAGEVKVRELGKDFRLEILQVPASFSYEKELIKEIGAEAVAKRVAAAGTKPKFVVTDLRPKSKASTTAIAVIERARAA